MEQQTKTATFVILPTFYNPTLMSLLVLKDDLLLIGTMRTRMVFGSTQYQKSEKCVTKHVGNAKVLRKISARNVRMATIFNRVPTRLHVIQAVPLHTTEILRLVYETYDIRPGLV